MDFFPSCVKDPAEAGTSFQVGLQAFLQEVCVDVATPLLIGVNVNEHKQVALENVGERETLICLSSQTCR